MESEDVQYVDPPEDFPEPGSPVTFHAEDDGRVLLDGITTIWTVADGQTPLTCRFVHRPTGKEGFQVVVFVHEGAARALCESHGDALGSRDVKAADFRQVHYMCKLNQWDMIICTQDKEYDPSGIPILPGSPSVRDDRFVLLWTAELYSFRPESPN